MPTATAVRKRRRSHSNASDSAPTAGNADIQGQTVVSGNQAPAVHSQPATQDSGPIQPEAPVVASTAKRRRASSAGSDKQAAAASNPPAAGQAESQSATTSTKRAAVKSKSVSTASFSALVPLKADSELHTPLLVPSTKHRETLKSEPASVIAADTSVPSVWDAPDDVSPEVSPAKPLQASTSMTEPASAVPAVGTAPATAEQRAAAAESALDGQLKRQQALLLRQKNAREALADFVAGTVSCHVFHSNFPEPEWHPALPPGARLCDSGPGRTALAEGMRAAKLAANSSLVGLRRRDLVEDLAAGRLLQSGLPALDQRLPTPHLGGFPLPINNAPWATGPVARRHIRKAGIGVRAPEKGIGPRWWGIKPLVDAPPDTPLALKMGVAGKFLKPMAAVQHARSAQGSVATPPAHPYPYGGGNGQPAQPAGSSAPYNPGAALPQGFNGARPAYANYPPSQHHAGGGSYQPPQPTAVRGAMVDTAAAAQHPPQRSYAPPVQAPGGQTAPPQWAAQKAPPSVPSAGAGRPTYGAAPPASSAGGGRPSYGAAPPTGGYVGSAAPARAPAPVAHEQSWRQRAAHAASSSSQAGAGVGAAAVTAPDMRDTASGRYSQPHGSARTGSRGDESRRSSNEQPRYDRYGAVSSDRRGGGGGYRGGDADRYGEVGSDRRSSGGGYRGGGGDRYGRSSSSHGDGYRGDPHWRSQRGGGADDRSRGDRGGYYGSAAPRPSSSGYERREQGVQRDHGERSYAVPAPAHDTGRQAMPPTPAAAAPSAAASNGSRGAPRPQSHSKGGASTRLNVGRGPRGGSGGNRR